MSWKDYPIFQREDKSFVIVMDEVPYHVPNEGEWVELYAEVADFYVNNESARAEVEFQYTDLHPEPTPPEPTFEEVKAVKLSTLNSKFAYAEEHAYLTSSLGIVINAGEKANRDIDGLIKLMEAMPRLEKVEFCCYDNSYSIVTLADLKTMQIEVILSGNALYQQKWAYRDAINAAQSKEELEDIQIEFVYSDFSVQGEVE